MAHRSRRTTTLLTVDTGSENPAPARFYRLMIRGSDRTVREDLLVPDGDKLKTTHSHEENLDEAA